MSSEDADIKTVAGHPKAQTVGGKRVSGKAEGEVKKIESGESPWESGVVEKKQNLTIAGAMTNEMKDYPVEGLKHAQNKPTAKIEPKHVQNNPQQNRQIHQPR